MNNGQRQYAMQHLSNVTAGPVAPSDQLLLECFNALTSAVAGDAARPYIDEQALTLIDPRTSPAARWPGNRRFAICLTHDVDSVSHHANLPKLGRRLRRLITGEGPLAAKSLKLAGAAARVCMEPFCADDIRDFDKWIDLEHSLGFRSTWYFLPERIEPVHAYDGDYSYADPVRFRRNLITVRQLMSEIADAGSEIGLHGSYLSGADSQILTGQKQQIEDAICQPVRCVRQHYLQYVHEASPHAHEAAGLICDSSVGLRTSVGFPSGTAFPYWCWNQAQERASRVLEIPLQVMDIALFHAAGGDLDSGLRLATSVMDCAAAVGGCITLNWHPEYGIIKPGYFEVYRDLIREAHHRGAWGCRATELYEVWTGIRAPSCVTEYTDSHPLDDSGGADGRRPQGRTANEAGQDRIARME